VRHRNAVQAGPWRTSIFSLLAVAGAAILIAGCGKSNTSTSATAPAETTPATPSAEPSSTSTAPAGESSSGSSSLSLAANTEGQLKYDKTSLSAKAGKVSIDFTNSSPIPHDVTVESSSGSRLGGTPTFNGGSKTLSLTLKPGTYKFFCSVPGHRQAGMEGTLTVK
jgi:plastocyanin